MINFSGKTKFFMKSTPTDMRKGYDGLASIVRDVMGHNPRNYNEAFVFYSKDYRKVKILHYDINGLAKTEHSHPLGMVVSTHFRCGKGVKRGLKNGALPFNID